MSMDSPKLGTVRIAPSVLAMIANLTTLETPGIARMGVGSNLHPAGGGLRTLSRGQQGASDGVRLVVLDGAVHVDVAVVARSGHSLRQLGKTVQQAVADALHLMVGMPVAEVNVFIEDVAD
jgi:uncharacterized alkaline shock family protein YloU